MEDFFDTYDLLLSPTMATPAFEIGKRPAVIGGKEVDPNWGFLPFTYPINMTGQTGSSVPCGFSADGMPIGLHIVGPRQAEARVPAGVGGVRGGTPVGRQDSAGLRVATAGISTSRSPRAATLLHLFTPTLSASSGRA